jgi:hypothetical protein
VGWAAVRAAGAKVGAVAEVAMEEVTLEVVRSVVVGGAA